MLWRCWLGGRKGIRPVKNWVLGCWRGHLSGVMCRLAYGLADATATHYLLLQWNPDWFYLSGTGSPGSPGKRAVKRVYVCMYIRQYFIFSVAVRICSHSSYLLSFIDIFAKINRILFFTHPVCQMHYECFCIPFYCIYETISFSVLSVLGCVHTNTN